MTKAKSYPTETHRRILEAASRRQGLIALPLPDGVQGAVAGTVVGKLIELGWLIEIPADLRRKEPIWRETRALGALTLVATAEGLVAIGTDPVASRTLNQRRRKENILLLNGVSKRGGTKQAYLVEMLKRDDGASVPEICAGTHWQAHSVRGAISGTIRKKLGLQVEIRKDPKRGRVYQIVRSSI